MAYLTGVRYIVVAVIIAAIAGISLAEAGNFFAETPKQAPRLGRRSATVSQLIPMKKAQRMKYFYAEIPKAMPRIGRRSEPVLQDAPPHWDQKSDTNPCWQRRHFLGTDSQEEGFRCLTLRELLQISLPFLRDASTKQRYDDNSLDDDYDDWYDGDLDQSSTPTSRGNRRPSIRELLRKEG